MRVLVTGAHGFIGKNLLQHLSSRSDIEVVTFLRCQTKEVMSSMIDSIDFVFHMAGVNRPQNINEFQTGNADITAHLCELIASSGKKIPIIYPSSIQASSDSPYGTSKRVAENILFEFQDFNGVPVYVFRLPNIFGKWAKPNYNSVVATFCHNIAHGLPIQINDPDAKLALAYIDDVIEVFLKIMNGDGCSKDENGFCVIEPLYLTTVGTIAKHILGFKESREKLFTERVGAGLTRALYSTYLSYLPVSDCVYKIPQHSDRRGIFVEMLKTPDCGQFSFFTAYPGVTRGGHFHHTKTEKFLVIRGKACFRFRHLVTGEVFEIFTSGLESKIVETLPGWVHDITNVGDDELVVMLWANEIFDKMKPDTFTQPI